MCLLLLVSVLGFPFCPMVICKSRTPVFHWVFSLGRFLQHSNIFLIRVLLEICGKLMIAIIIFKAAVNKMKHLPQRLCPSVFVKIRKKSMKRYTNFLCCLKALWIRKSAHFHKHPEREYFNINPDQSNLGSMYFLTTTNYKRTDHYNVFNEPKYFCLWKDCWLNWKRQRKNHICLKTCKSILSLCFLLSSLS